MKCKYCGKVLTYEDGVVSMFEKGKTKMCADCLLVGKPKKLKGVPDEN